MTKKVKTAKDYPTLFQITKVDKDKYVILSVLNKKQLDSLMWQLEQEFEPKARQWRGQYQALAKAVAEARHKLED